MDTDRTKDSVEQVEDADLSNPITDDDAELGEAGDAMWPQGEDPERDKDCQIHAAPGFGAAWEARLSGRADRSRRFQPDSAPRVCQ